jgi:predicted porin
MELVVTTQRTIRLAVTLAALSAASLAHAQSGPAPTASNDNSLTWRGITLYGTIDIGLQYESHGAPFSDFYTPASTNIIQKPGREGVFGATGSNESQSKVGLRGIEPIAGDWSGVFAVETWFNPQAGDLSDSLKSLTINNGLASNKQGTNSDGASAGQAFQIGYVGISSKTFGTLTLGRQQNLVSDGVNALDPNRGAPAFSLLGASGTYAGAGTTEDKRLDSAAKYIFNYAGVVHIAALYKFNDANASAGGTAFQANIGGNYAGLTLDGFYSKINDAVSATSLSAAQLTGLSKLGFSSNTSVSATISDNTTLAVMAAYKIDPIPVRLYAGYEHIQFANPTHPLSAGTSGLGGYILAYVTNTAYTNDRKLDVYWTGVRYSVRPKLDITAAFYGYHQNAYGTGTAAGCATSANSACSGSLRAYSIDANYQLTRRFDAYAGIMYSAVADGVASGYTDTTNINPTIGIRFVF